MIKFSVIIPCYNMEKYIGRTLDNVLQQTYQSFEVVVVDDGSTDKTLEIIRDYQAKDERVKIYAKKQNQGLSAARNTGIKNSTGEYVLFLDGDDAVKETLFERALQIFAHEQIDMFSFGYQIVEEKTNRILKKRSQPKYDNKNFSGREFMILYLQKKISQHICSLIVRRQVFADNNIWFDENIRYGEDQDFQLRCMPKCRNIYYTSEELFFYTKRTGSLINRKLSAKRIDEIKVFLKIEAELKNEVQSFYVRNYLCFHFVYLYREAMKYGFDRAFIQEYLKHDYLLKGFKMEFTKHNLITFMFILSYSTLLRKMLHDRG